MAVSLAHEAALWDAGATVVAGIDEVGRGALAGPVTVGVCAVARCDAWPEGLADSKELTPARRLRMADALAGFGAARAVAHASPAEIDALGIVGALRLAGTRALAAIAAEGVRVDAVLLDGKHDWLTPPPATLFGDLDAPDPASASALQEPAVPTPPVTMVIKGDTLCASIAAGSVLAKVERDGLMAEAHERHPEFGWAGNKGYGAAAHLDAIRLLGPTDEHRRSWSLPERT
ncbi:ribonuclease HII [Demequina sp. NBRC 110056]|uniref:ribonuclease HII n=1 Tax=Demequina sp. NBRC 110056 TaxID=1570345 RepID=UPI000A000C75|nr:ribonuclease HII [Demequina sp. NBRC 110056]